MFLIPAIFNIAVGAERRIMIRNFKSPEPKPTKKTLHYKD